VLKAIGADVYVGDTPAAMAAAVAAGAHAVGVTTGSFTAGDLRAAGAADVLASMSDFPPLYRKLAT
jgi:phosphoglycolate phosphatase